MHINRERCSGIDEQIDNNMALDGRKKVGNVYSIPIHSVVWLTKFDMSRMSFIRPALQCASSAQVANPIAKVRCELISRLYSKLEQQFGSSCTAWGLRNPEQMMEVWTDRRGNWMLLVSYATGMSCIVAMDEDWMQNPAQDPAQVFNPETLRFLFVPGVDRRLRGPHHGP